MPRLQDIERFKRDLAALSNETEVLERWGEKPEVLPPPESAAAASVVPPAPAQEGRIAAGPTPRPAGPAQPASEPEPEDEGAPPDFAALLDGLPLEAEAGDEGGAGSIDDDLAALLGSPASGTGELEPIPEPEALPGLKTCPISRRSPWLETREHRSLSTSRCLTSSRRPRLRRKKVPGRSARSHRSPRRPRRPRPVPLLNPSPLPTIFRYRSSSSWRKPRRRGFPKKPRARSSRGTSAFPTSEKSRRMRSLRLRFRNRARFRAPPPPMPGASASPRTPSSPSASRNRAPWRVSAKGNRPMARAATSTRKSPL